MKIEIKYDRKADFVYLYFSDRKVAFSKKLDTERTVDYSEEGEIRGIKFYSASSVMKTDDLPHRSAIERALQGKDVVRILHKHGANHATNGSYQDTNDSGESFLKAEVKAIIASPIWTIVTLLTCIALSATDIVLARNLFVLSSLTGIVASLIGLVVAMFPTVAAGLILLAWVFYAHSQTGRL